MHELACFERAPHEVTVSLEHFTESGFGETPVWWAFVAEADNEVVHAMGGVDLHDVPQDGPLTDLDHRLRNALSLFSEARAQTTGKDDGLIAITRLEASVVAEFQANLRRASAELVCFSEPAHRGNRGSTGRFRLA